MIQKREKQNILRFERLAPMNVSHFWLIDNLNPNSWLTLIIFQHFSPFDFAPSLHYPFRPLALGRFTQPYITTLPPLVICHFLSPCCHPAIPPLLGLWVRADLKPLTMSFHSARKSHRKYFNRCFKQETAKRKDMFGLSGMSHISLYMQFHVSIVLAYAICHWEKKVLSF